MLGPVVNFEGRAWPLAQVAGSRPLTVTFVGPAGMLPPTPRLMFDLTAGSKSRPWSTTFTQGLWRTFAETMDSGDGAQVAKFVQRYGDPVGKLDTEGAVCTDAWLPVVAALSPIARAWGAEDIEGVSRINRMRVDDAAAILRWAVKDFAPELTVIADPNGAADLALEARSLASFMWLSAVSALKRRTPLRRCRTCTAWYELARKDQLYCSNACKIAHHRAQDAAAEAAWLERLRDPEAFRVAQAKKAAEMAAMLEHLDPVKRRRKQAEMEAQMAALTRHLNKKSDNKKD
jgi:hypothetical protein